MRGLLIDMEKILTVSIAAYNVGPFLRQALQSCVIEGMDLLEVIVVDDGSSDDTVDVAREYVEKYPGTFRLLSKDNGGYGSTINASLPLARGKYYKLLDGDDWFDTENLEAYVSELHQTNADLSVSCITEVYVSTGEELVLDKAPDYEEGVYSLGDVDFNGLLAMHSVAYRTDLLRRIGLTITENCFYTDIEFLLIPLPFVETVHVVHRSVYQYRIGRGDQSMSIAGVQKHFKEHEIMLNRMLGVRDGYLSQGITLPDNFEKRMVREVRRHYKFLLVLPDRKERMSQLNEFDKRMQDYPELLSTVEKSNEMVRLLRKTGFVFHGIASWIASRDTVRV